LTPDIDWLASATAGLIQTRPRLRCRKSAAMDANTLELLDCYRSVW
jgi:hypothetical protein